MVRAREREFFIDNLLVRIHFIIVMIRWIGLAPWGFEFPFPGSLTSTFLEGERSLRADYAQLLGGNRHVLSDDFVGVGRPSRIFLIDFSRHFPKKQIDSPDVAGFVV